MESKEDKTFKESIDNCLSGKKSLVQKVGGLDTCFYRPFSEDLDITPFCKYQGMKVTGQIDQYYICDKPKGKEDKEDYKCGGSCDGCDCE